MGSKDLLISKDNSSESRAKINYSRKHFVHGDVLLISSRTEEGLPFPPNHLMNSLITGILAKAQQLYPVRICHFLFMSNHFHLLIKVEDPAAVPAFVGYLKGEISHSVNRLLGRRRKTVFVRKYDSPKFLLPEDVKRYIKYIYLNPTKENLESCIENYPGLNTWDAYLSGRVQRVKTKKISRHEILRLPSPSLSVSESQRLAESYQRDSKGESLELLIEPDAWAESFPEVKLDEFKKELVSELRQEEELLALKRKEQGREVVGATRLKRASMGLEYRPKKFSKRMTVICSDLKARKEYLLRFKGLCEEAYNVYSDWKQGLRSSLFPPGMFSPAMPTLVWEVPLRG